MKTPRFFITLTVYAVASTIALSSLESVFRPASAETLPVLRVNPWAGDPDSPGAPRDIPLDEGWGELRTNITYDTYSPSQSLTPRVPEDSSWRQFSNSRWFMALLQTWRWRW